MDAIWIILLCILAVPAFLLLGTLLGMLQNKTQKQKGVQIKEPSPFEFQTGKNGFFPGLFSRLSHFKEYGTRRFIDIIIFALFKTRLCASMYVSDEYLDENKQQELMIRYDFFQFVFINEWMDKNASAYAKKAEIISNRFATYENVFLNSSDSSMPWLMNTLSHTFYWILDNGWEVDATGKQTTHPSENFDLSNIQAMRYAESKYLPIVSEMDMIVFDYCDREFPSLFALLESDD